MSDTPSSGILPTALHLDIGAFIQQREDELCSNNLAVDLSRGRVPEEFYDCIIPDRFQVPSWRERPEALDFRLPESNGCALRNVRMLFLVEGLECPPFLDLFYQATEAGVYVKNPDETWHGARHEQLVEFLKTFGFDAFREENLSTDDVAYWMAQGFYGLLSVYPDIRFPTKKKPVSPIGHIVLTYKYTQDRLGRRSFWIQNASGFAHLDSQIGMRVSNARMIQVFKERAIFARLPRS